MKASDFSIGMQYRIASEPKETRTVTAVHEDYITYDSDLPRFKGVTGIATDTALGAQVIEIIEELRKAA